MVDQASGGDPDTRSETEDVLGRLFRDSRVNAGIAWVLVGILGLVFIESVFDADRLWLLFVAATGAIVLIPPVAHREWQMMLPWELLVLALLPILVRALFGGELGTFGYYFSVAALALIVTVQVHMFTELQLTHWFAVLFVVLATMASVVLWTIVQWNLDQQLGTTFLIDATTSQETANAALMWEFIWVTLAGLAAGIVFDSYFRRRGRRLRRRLFGVLRR